MIGVVHELVRKHHRPLCTLVLPLLERVFVSVCTHRFVLWRCWSGGAFPVEAAEL